MNIILTKDCAVVLYMTDRPKDQKIIYFIEHL